jgi:hypothetical protein
LSQQILVFRSGSLKDADYCLAALGTPSSSNLMAIVDVEQDSSLKLRFSIVAQKSLTRQVLV